MKAKWIFVAAAVIFNSSIAIAGEAENKIFSASNGFKARYLSDSGDIKLAFLEAENMVLGVFGGGPNVRQGEPEISPEPIEECLTLWPKPMPKRFMLRQPTWTTTLTNVPRCTRNVGTIWLGSRDY